MKKVLLMALFFVVSFLSLSVNAKGKLTEKKEISFGQIKTSGGAKGDGIARCPTMNPATAFICHKIVTVDFLSSEDVIIVVTNLITGEILLSESYLTTNNAIFELNAEFGTNCKIEIITESWSLEGEFSI